MSIIAGMEKDEIMTKDPLVEDVRAARRKIFDACNEDLDALLDRFQEREKLHRERVVSSVRRLP
jgi:hypothetical protein